jgi:multimeric flavodoxin WrbA
MRIVLINGSPRQNGCTGECIKYLESLFKEDGVETVTINIPSYIGHCTNCRKCKKLDSACVKDEYFKSVETILNKADGIIIGSPVYYYSVTSQLQAFITRLCYSRPHILEHKLCSFFSVSRRTGNTDCFNQFMKIFQMHNAIMVGGNYVNEIYGDNPEELQYDKEGLLSLRMIEKNFLALLPLIKDAKFYEEKKVHTNFISREFLAYVNKEKEKEEYNKLLIESYS